jgi:hypothetical protein
VQFCNTNVFRVGPQKKLSISRVTFSVPGRKVVLLSPLLVSSRVGIISLVVLAIAIGARYVLHLVGAWRRTYVISAAVALYLNVFVLVVQSFEKVLALKAAAPTQKEAPFVVAPLVVMALFVVLTIFAAERFHSEPAPVARSASKAA